MNNQFELNNSHGKRRRLEGINNLMNDSYNTVVPGNKQFLPIRHSNSLFHTEDWNSSGTALFKPVYEDLLINSSKYEQISCGDGNFFVADEKGNYSKTVTGHIIQLWKYDKLARKLFVARTFLFTDLQEYMVVQQFLQRL